MTPAHSGEDRRLGLAAPLSALLAAFTIEFDGHQVRVRAEVDVGIVLPVEDVARPEKKSGQEVGRKVDVGANPPIRLVPSP